MKTPIRFPTHRGKQAAFAAALAAPYLAGRPLAERLWKAAAFAQHSFPPEPHRAEPVEGRPAAPGMLRTASRKRAARRNRQRGARVQGRGPGTKPPSRSD